MLDHRHKTIPQEIVRLDPQHARGKVGSKPRLHKTPTWFALDDSRPAFAFAGIWTRWSGTGGPKSKPAAGEHRLFGFLTCAPSAVVRPIHPQAMPVILTTVAEWDAWLQAPWTEASRLQRSLQDHALRIVATGAKEDPPPTADQHELLL